jgi:hypothetical protein
LQADPALLLFVGFNDAVRIRGIRVTAPPPSKQESGPKCIRLFIGAPSLDFEGALVHKPDEILTLKPEQLDGREISLAPVKFRNVRQLSILMETNQDSTPTTVFSRLSFVGSPIAGFNMADLKKTECC